MDLQSRSNGKSPSDIFITTILHSRNRQGNTALKEQGSPNFSRYLYEDTRHPTPDTQPEANVETEMLRQKSKVPTNKDLTTAATKPTESCYKAELDTPKVQITRSGRVMKPLQRLIQDT